jgi:hypothetical protein
MALSTGSAPQPATETTPVTTTVTETTTTAIWTTSAPAEQPQVSLRGDTDCSGIVDVSDVVLTARFLAEDGEAVLSSQGKANADIDGVPGISTDDTSMMLRIIAKLI